MARVDTAHTFILPLRTRFVVSGRQSSRMSSRSGVSSVASRASTSASSATSRSSKPHWK